MKFKATISSRSSSHASGPPGETEILRLNPQRCEMILAETGWNELVEGTLNLEVNKDVVSQLLTRKPTIREPGSSVYYPVPYQNIPKMRKVYLYFRGTISKGNHSENVLFRTAEKPLPNRLEAFAPVRLRESLSIADGDQVICDIHNLRC